MKLDYCFHGTSIDNAQNIFKTRNVYTNVNTHNLCFIKKIFKEKYYGKYTSIEISDIRRNMGSIGLGFYSFHFSRTNAELFANKMRKKDKYKKHAAILKFKIKNDFKENIIDFTDHEILEMYNIYLSRHKSKAKYIKDRFNFTNETAAKKLDGIMVEGFINFIQKKNNVEILAAYSLTQNKIGVYLSNTTMPNSFEMSIRNNKIIDYDTMSLEEINWKRNDLYEDKLFRWRI